MATPEKRIPYFGERIIRELSIDTSKVDLPALKRRWSNTKDITGKDPKEVMEELEEDQENKV